ncbi:MAG: choice-of-anchor D domain-containing protein, partial [Acidobacteriota bacterium]
MNSKPVTSPAASLALRGKVHGGQQPVSGSTIQLYAVGFSGGGSASTPLLAATVTSDGGGGFTITGAYTCPTAGSQVYIVARGGNPGLTAGTNNTAIVLAAALGPCGNLGTSTFININEVTTAALANALAPFYGSTTSIGSLPADAVVLDSAFALANQYASTGTGVSPGDSLVNGTTIPVAEINTLADILASCVNSTGGVAGDTSACGSLFSLTTAPGLNSPADTFAAAVRLADNPSLNTNALFNSSAAIAPFQPTLSTAPAAFSVAPTIVSGLQPSLTTAAFGSVNAGSAAAGLTLTLTNTSNSPIAISSLSISGNSPGDFSQVSSCPASLGVSSSCTVQLGFSPTAAGRRVAELAINNDSPGSPLLIALSGIGVGQTVTTPTLTSLSPSSFTAGAPNTIVTLTGTGFTSSTLIYLGGQLQTATYISPQSISFIVASYYLSSAANLSIYVRNSAGISNTLTLPVNNPAPTLTSISPASAIAGAPNFTITLTGSNFLYGSTVLVNGVSQTFNFISSTSISLIITSSEVTTPGTLNISVSNSTPGGGSSANVPLQVVTSTNRSRTLPYVAADIVADPVRNMLYASVVSSSSNSPNTIVEIDPTQGTVVASQALPSSPDRLAISDDGSYLYVSLYSAAKIERLILPSLTPDITWSIGSGGAGDLAVAPGNPHTLAVSTIPSNPNAGGRTVTIYDDAVARPLNPAPSYTTISYDTLAWGADASTLYSTESGTSGGPEYVLSVNSNGPTLTNNFYGAFGDFTSRLIYDKSTGYLFDTYGHAINPSNGLRVGSFNLQNYIGYGQEAVTVDSA